MKGAIQQRAATRRPAGERTRSLAVAASVAKYVLLTVAGFALFEWAHAVASAERGYEAIGGEVFLLALPLVWFGLESMIRDMVTMAREFGKGGEAE